MSNGSGGIVSKYALKKEAQAAGTYVAPVQEESAPDVHPNAPATYDPKAYYGGPLSHQKLGTGLQPPMPRRVFK